MRLFHLADLHLGKRVNGFIQREDQAFALKHVLSLMDAQHPDVLLLAGDIYDTGYPPEYAISLLNWFLTEVTKERGIPVIMTGGNHDSSERLGFGSDLLALSGVHIVTQYKGAIEPIMLTTNTAGQVAFWPIPFVRATEVQNYQDPESPKITSTHEALATIVRDIQAHPTYAAADFNVVMAHQFVVSGQKGPETSDSESFTLGTLDSVDASVFADFDYAALGHIHRPQQIGAPHIRYAGSLAMYSFSEMNRPKTMPVVTLTKEGHKVEIALEPLTQLHGMREVRGTLEEVVRASRQESEKERQDYLKVVLTDEDEPVGALDALKAVYPNTMIVRYDNARTRAQEAEQLATPEAISKDYFQLFSEFYEQQNGVALDAERAELVRRAFKAQSGAELGEDA